jgi:hypothetical protein
VSLLIASRTWVTEGEASQSVNTDSRKSMYSLTAIPCRMHRISFDLRSEAAQGPVSTRVGDRLGRP